MKYMKIQMKCKYVHFNKKYYCFSMLVEVEHTIPCIFDQCRSVWKSLQVLSAQVHIHSIISVVETFRVLWNVTSKTKCSCVAK